MRDIVAVFVVAFIAFASTKDIATVGDRPAPRCGPNQVYVSNSSGLCNERLCVTFKSEKYPTCTDPRCGDRRTQGRCECAPGYARISDSECEEINSCKCRFVADIRDPRIYTDCTGICDGRCPSQNQVYVESGLVDLCDQDLCLTFRYPEGYDMCSSCSEPQPIKGCKCADGYALAGIDKCVPKDSCECLGIASRLDERYYKSCGCDDKYPCDDVNQDYEFGPLGLCNQDLCVTMSPEIPRKYKCTNGTRPEYGMACRCRAGFALIDENNCVRAGGCKCPAVASVTDPYFFPNEGCQARLIG